MREEWMTHYGQIYANAIEKERRYNIFKDNVEYINSFNRQEGNSFKLSVNKFTDQSNEEFRASQNAHRTLSDAKLPKAVTLYHKDVNAIPQSLDWRKKGAVTPVRNETCGSWGFPAVDNVEGFTQIKTGKLYTLSVQEILDCNSLGIQGCSGGFTDNAFEFIRQNGLTTKSNYISKNGTCNTEKQKEPVTKINGYNSVEADSEESLMEAVANQPVAVGVDAGGINFQFYSSGILTDSCGTDLNLGVTVVGYGVGDDGMKYWLIKNGWGRDWGEEGYMRLQKDISAKEGQCGIAMEPTYPVA